MKSKLTAVCIGICGAALVAGSLLAAEVTTRSKEDAQADLMRTYQTPGGPPAGTIRTRSKDDANSDLMRDWTAKPSGEAGEVINTRSEEDANADLMRDWSRPEAAPESKEKATAENK